MHGCDQGMEVSHVDQLLERYLVLLDEYSTLRAELGSLQTAMYQHLARANFSAERGLRFGQDLYDGRMQASRRVSVLVGGDGDEGVPSFSLRPEPGPEPELEPEPEPPITAPSTAEADAEAEAHDLEAERSLDAEVSAANVVPDGEVLEPASSSRPAEVQRLTKKDPLHWFGLLSPMALRHVQAQSIQAVEQVIPRLVSVSAEMAHVEVQVRRARNKRIKAEAAARTQQQATAINPSGQICGISTR